MSMAFQQLSIAETLVAIQEDLEEFKLLSAREAAAAARLGEITQAATEHTVADLHAAQAELRELNRQVQGMERRIEDSFRHAVYLAGRPRQDDAAEGT